MAHTGVVKKYNSDKAKIWGVGYFFLQGKRMFRVIRTILRRTHES